MKKSFYVLFFMIGITTMVLIVEAMGFNPQPMTPYDPADIADDLNATNVIGQFDPGDRDFYDIGTGLQTLWNKKVPIIEGAIDFFDRLGVPDPIIAAILVPWRFFWFGFVLEFVSGRDFLP